MPLTDNAVAFWDLGDDSNDDSGNGRNGSDTDVTYDGTSASFNGSSSVITVAHNAVFNFTTAITISGWFKTSQSGSNGHIINKQDDSFYVGINTGTANKVAFYANGPTDDSGWLNSTSDANNNAWHHVVATFDDTTVRIYFDGSEQANVPDTHDITTGTADIKIGARVGASQYLSGLIRCLGLFSDTKDSTWVTSVYNSGTPMTWAAMAGGAATAHNLMLLGVGG